MRNEMNITPGYVYHIKDAYFDVVKDAALMRNHEGGMGRPTYLCVKDEAGGLLWAVPMSRRIEKYKTIIDRDKARYGRCVKLVIALYGGKENAFLFQNMFPTTERYIDHIHTINGIPALVDWSIRQEITRAFKECLRLHRRGVKVIFTDISRLELLMLAEQRKEHEALADRPLAIEEWEAVRHNEDSPDHPLDTSR